jgi:hypothetical protein
LKLLVNPADHAAAYQAAAPFPHAVIDGAFSESWLRMLTKFFPNPTDGHWAHHETKVEKKLATHGDHLLSSNLRQLLLWFNSSTFVNFLEELTGIRGLIPDPHFEGAGSHCTVKGGFLGLHTDYRFHRRLGLDRRVNALLYLNEGWQPEHGGELELWNHSRWGIGPREMKPMPFQCVQSIAPTWGRLVVFNTTDFSFHGHPDPYKGPARRSIALYYFTAGRPASEVWVPEGGQHTLFYPRPGTADADPQANTRAILRRPNLYAWLRATKKIITEGL